MILVPAPMRMPRRSIVCDAADFDGAADYATRGGDLSGISDAKAYTFAGWFKSETTGLAQSLLGNATALAGSGTPRTYFQKNSTNVVAAAGFNAAGVAIMSLRSNSALPNAWTWVGISCDLSDTAKRHMYFGDTNELVVSIYTDDTLDMSLADWAIGARADGTQKYDGGIAELMFWPGVYTDFSVTDNRRLFISAAGKPVDPAAASGALATLGAPAIYFHLNDAETANNFVANDDGGATGGAFTVTGALTTYASSPSD